MPASPFFVRDLRFAIFGEEIREFIRKHLVIRATMAEIPGDKVASSAACCLDAGLGKFPLPMAETARALFRLTSVPTRIAKRGYIPPVGPLLHLFESLYAPILRYPPSLRMMCLMLLFIALEWQRRSTKQHSCKLHRGPVR